MRVCCSPTPAKCSHCAMKGEISRSSSVSPSSENLTHPGDAPELPREEDQPSPAVLVPRGEATKEKTGKGTKGMGTQISHCLTHLEEGGSLPRKLHSLSEPEERSKQQEVREPPSFQELPAPGTSTTDREKRDLEREMVTTDDTTATIPQTWQSWEGIPFPPASSSLSSQVQKSRHVRRILVFHIPPAPKIQGTPEVFSGSSQDPTELMFSSLRNIPAREEPQCVLGLAQLD